MFFKKYVLISYLLLTLTFLTACDLLGLNSSPTPPGVKAKVTATISESNINGTYVLMQGDDSLTIIITGTTGQLTIQKADGSQESEKIELDTKTNILKVAGEEAAYTTTDQSLTVSPKAKDSRFFTETLTFAKQ